MIDISMIGQPITIKQSINSGLSFSLSLGECGHGEVVLVVRESVNRNKAQKGVLAERG